MASCLSRHDQMVYSIFQNHAPRGVKFFQMIPKWRKVFIKMDWLLTMITNPFEIPVIQNLGNIFIFSFFTFLFKTKYHPISRQKQNEKLFFCIFFSGSQNTHFFLTSQKEFLRILNDVIKFINTKIRKLIFSIFFFSYRKIHNTCICFIINLQKEILEQRSFHVF